MSVITLRGLNAKAEKQARRRAVRIGKSMNRFLVDLIEDKVLGNKDGKPHEYDDLNHLFRSMAKEDAKIIENSAKEQRKIDSELWS